MQMVGDPRSGRLTGVVADVDSVRPIDGLKDELRLVDQFHQFTARLNGEMIQPRRVLIGNDEHVSVVIRIEIKNDESVFPAMDHVTGLD